ncbi:hypothetical protein CROQUDRAFT_42858 [Cronartium quercuum f. sp. fusiforme G11]|uniref:Glutamine amidotransferase domain-containing protein n=1 Tax=Cronartium quercuum f. sp. fusiforme G11 TaxID=708437 RepID=A0A9P6TCK9_9BASI|nr:hypothetical protein CROQUDRAFT_42858 [Cronartium quercuum f. sp. fusiforme G11]
MLQSLITSNGLTECSKDEVFPTGFPTIIILSAYSFPPSTVTKHGSFHQIFCELFRNALSIQSPTSSTSLRVMSFDILSNEYPTEDHLNSSNGLLVTGSTASAFDDIPWITSLKDFCSQMPESFPHLKLFGICFGHQIVSRAFGSLVEKNPLGWEIGVPHIKLSDVGKRVMDINNNGEIRLQQFHRDAVTTIPDCFDSIGSTSSCPIQGMLRYASHVSPNRTEEELTDIQILTFQGHPEFHPEIAVSCIDSYVQSGTFDVKLGEKLKEQVRMDDDGIRIGSLILKIIGTIW